jgi:two-component system alkaline phosphatase synthesis response regulator PhoP
MEANILLVEDEPLSRRNLALLLETEGYRVSEVENGEDAVELIKGMAFDLVITDLVLPGSVNGLDVVVCHRRVSPGKGAILMTGFGSGPLEEKALALDIDYLPKPIDLDELLLKVKNLVAR